MVEKVLTMQMIQAWDHTTSLLTYEISNISHSSKTTMDFLKEKTSLLDLQTDSLRQFVSYKSKILA